jgi:hypothetical protein
MVMPRAFSSGAASIWSYALASPPNSLDSTVVIAAVRVVLPWSTWPDGAHVHVRLGPLEFALCHLKLR